MSWASSVTLNSVRRTGSARLGPQTKRVKGAVGGMTSMVPAASSAVLAITRQLFGIDQHLQRRELRVDAHADGRSPRPLELVGGVDLDLQLDGLHRRALQAQGLRAVPLAAARSAPPACASACPGCTGRRSRAAPDPRCRSRRSRPSGALESLGTRSCGVSFRHGSNGGGSFPPPWIIISSNSRALKAPPRAWAPRPGPGEVVG